MEWCSAVYSWAGWLQGNSSDVVSPMCSLQQTSALLDIPAQRSHLSQPGGQPPGNAPGRPAYRAHIDFRFVKNNLDVVRQNVADRNSAADPDAVAALYDKWVSALDQVERLRAERNANAKAMKVGRRPRCPMTYTKSVLDLPAPVGRGGNALQSLGGFSNAEQPGGTDAHDAGHSGVTA